MEKCLWHLWRLVFARPKSSGLLRLIMVAQGVIAWCKFESSLVLEHVRTFFFSSYRKFEAMRVNCARPVSWIRSPLSDEPASRRFLLLISQLTQRILQLGSCYEFSV